MNSGKTWAMLALLVVWFLNPVARADALTEYCATLLGAAVAHDVPDVLDALRDAERVANAWSRSVFEPAPNSVGRMLSVDLSLRAQENWDDREVLAAAVAIDGQSLPLIPNLALRAELARSQARLVRLRRGRDRAFVRYEFIARGPDQTREILRRLGDTRDKGVTLLARAYTVLDALVKSEVAEDPFVHVSHRRPLSSADATRFGVEAEDTEGALTLTLDQVLYRDSRGNELVLVGITRVVGE